MVAGAHQVYLFYSPKLVFDLFLCVFGALEPELYPGTDDVSLLE
ncbi:hypothetical protein C900_00781 [Fulvivirga imtechensis AK7]|uniref:Uncharacterized protein n=1 Tax=Fulvivirga imtechensis AK7 TaxID=1237149 RepID=L8JVK2_9BACT|nr:hypothetical protein C900_00781 [Fulvivirga imtechensis AK7]